MTTATKSRASIGASVIGLLTAGMYNDPLAVCREYVQNAVDALLAEGPEEEGLIRISVDREAKSLTVRDNGPGLSRRQCEEELIPVGRSTKRPGVDRGFRGIGRLSGLAYAQEIIFRTRQRAGEPVTTLRWKNPGGDAAPGAPLGAEDVLNRCITVAADPGRGRPGRFFEVEVSGVSRHAAGFLLNEEAIGQYVGETCPVPFREDFPWRREVDGLLDDHRTGETCRIVVGAAEKEARRPHGAGIRLSPQREVPYERVERIIIPGLEVPIAAVGWIAHTEYAGALPREGRVRGIRLRAGNIQLGDENIVAHLFAEERFNRWAVGEIHLLDPALRPNARRDYLEPGPHARHLENHLGAVCKGIATGCRRASTERNRTRRTARATERIRQAIEVITSGYLDTGERDALAARALAECRAISTDAECAETRGSSLEDAVREAHHAKSAEPYAGMERKSREAFQHAFAAILEQSDSPDLALRTMGRAIERARRQEEGDHAERAA